MLPLIIAAVAVAVPVIAVRKLNKALDKSANSSKAAILSLKEIPRRKKSTLTDKIGFTIGAHGLL
jgi:hypothetical protein